MTSKAAKIESEETSSAEVEVSENSPPESGKTEIIELRRLIVQADEVGEVLPTAITQSTNKDNKLAEATLPLVEENIRQSVRQNPDVLAEALFPAIGPAIRKAIAEALSQMVQSLNQTLENSLSPRGLRWRLEAWQTGKPFAEVVLLNSLVYRVEEVFLIHRETGGLLQHASLPKNVSEDADMVSAMLTAIQDFAHDSFKDSENEMLNSLNFNELLVWVERSPHAVLAGVIRGNPPLTLREIFKEAIEAIEFVQREEFENFDGDTAKFEKSRPMLDNCLQFQLNQGAEKKGKWFSPFNLLAGAAGLAILIFGFIYLRDYWRWSNYLNRLKNEPGIAVTEERRGWWRDSISGLRDPLAVNPDEVLSEYNLDKNWIESDWKPYQDLSSKMILKRAVQILKPPEEVNLSFENGILNADGKITNEWFAEAKKLSAALPGVNEFRLGQAGLQSKIESQSIYFVCKTADFSDGQTSKVAEIIRDLEMLTEGGKNWRLEINGQADQTGTDETNAQISQQRADKVLAELLKSEKIKAVSQSIKAVGVGVREGSNCKVDFKVIFTER
jgi:OOP family OmpA-OmpF porin